MIGAWKVMKMTDTMENGVKSSVGDSAELSSRDFVNKTRNQVLEIITLESIPRSLIAKQSEIAEGTLGPWLNQKYAGQQEPIAEKLSKWLNKREDESRQKAIMPIMPDYQDTLTSKKMMGIISRAHMSGDMVVLGCGPGTGKTTTGKRYKETRPNVYMPTFDPSSSNVNTCLLEVLAAMNYPDAKGTPQALSRLIIAKIEGAGAIFIFDESQWLGVKAIELLRAIHDRTGCAMVFMGDERIFDVFGANKGGQFSQLTSRIGFRHRQSKPKIEDVDVLLKAHGIEDKQVLKIGFQISQKPGALRGLTKALLIARQRAALDGRPVDNVTLTDAWANLAPEHQLGLRGGVI